MGMIWSKAMSCHGFCRHTSRNNSICTIFCLQCDSMGNGADGGEVERERVGAAAGSRQCVETDKTRLKRAEMLHEEVIPAQQRQAAAPVG